MLHTTSSSRSSSVRLGWPFRARSSWAQPGLHLLLFQQGVAGFVVGVQHDLAGLAVHKGLLALVLRPEQPFGPEYGGNAHGAGEYSRVAVGAAALGDKGQNLGFVQLNGLAGGQLIADQNYRPLQFQPALGRPERMRRMRRPTSRMSSPRACI